MDAEKLLGAKIIRVSENERNGIEAIFLDNGWVITPSEYIIIEKSRDQEVEG